MREAVIVAAARTPVGRAKRGTLRSTRADEMAAVVMEEVIRRAPGVEKGEVEDVALGCSFPEGSQGLNMARAALLRAGFPNSIPGQTINRYCASGLQSIASACQQVLAGESDIVVAGGAESMSMVPMVGHHFDPNPWLVENMPQLFMSMGLTAERVAEQYGVSREDQDLFGLASNDKALAAIKNGKFKDETISLNVETQEVGPDGKLKVKKILFDIDEGPRKTTLEKMAELRPSFKKNGTVTPGNSSQMSDGAAAVLVMEAQVAKARGLKPLVRFVGFAAAGVPPEVMGIGPIAAIPRVLKKTGISLNQIDLIELNEAFASQALAVIRTLGLNPEITNVNGGAVALGHPLGCTGSKLTTQLIYEMPRRKARFGLVSMCIGMGMGAAGIFENLQ
jgi:acetyl-CoA acyltransferase